MNILQERTKTKMARCTCHDCGDYTPQQKRWGVCEATTGDDGRLVVKRNRKACAEFRYYRGGYDG